MRKLIFAFVGILFSLPLLAQPKGFVAVSAAQKQTYQQSLSRALAATTTISCQFTEEKKSSMLATPALSSGVMYYQKPSAMRWEYTQPDAMAFVLHDDMISVKRAGKVTTNANRMIKEMTKLIAGFVSGENLKNEKDFTTTYYTNGTELWVVFVPNSQQMKLMFTKIALRLTIKTAVATQIVRYEANGDTTTTTLQQHQLNQPLPSNIFILK